MPAKVDRQVRHITQSEQKQGKSKKEAERIAWATVNSQKKKKKNG